MGDSRTGVFVFYVLAGSFTLGIFLRSFFTLGLVEVVWLMLLAVAIALLWRQADVSDLRIWLLYGAVIFVGLATGILRLEIASWSEVLLQYETRLGKAVAVTGTIVREPDEREQLTHLYVQVEDELLLVTTDRFQQFSYGDVVTVSGTLEKPEPFMTDLGRTFNYPGYLRARGVNYVLPFSDVEVIEQGAGNIILTKLFAFKRTFMDALEQVVEEPMVGLGEGLLLGVKRALGSELETVFRQTGIIHIVVLSGYNVMLVVAFVMYLLGSLLPRRWQVGFGIVAITLFALLVGLGATVVRASLMAGILLVLSLTGRTYFVIRALVLAGAIMLIANPYLLAFDVGFQLSFMATLGLILLAPAIIARITWLPDWFGAREFLAATVATQIFVAPILLYQIGEFSLIAVIVNVLVLPMVPVAMLLTFITGLIGMLAPTVAVYVGLLADLSLWYIIVVATQFATVPYASMAVPPLPFFTVPLAYGLGFAYWWYRSSWSIESDDVLAGWTIVSESDIKTARRS